MTVGNDLSILYTVFFDFPGPGHLFAVQQSKLAKHQDLQKLIATKYDQDDDMALNLLKTAYHLGKRELPKEEMRHMVEFASSFGVEFKSNSSTHMYTSNKSVTELQSCLADVILEDKMNEICECGPFAIIIDESTDNANTKRILIYVQYLSNNGEKKVCLLGNKQINEGSANAVNLTSIVLNAIKEKGLDIETMVGIGTDGASVMTGSTGGVVTLLRQHSPSLVGVHCAAHRTALASSQAAKQFPQLEQFQRTVTSIFRYFKNSALRSNRLRKIQQMLNLPTLKYAEVHSIRWLSVEYAVKVIYRTYPALVMTLDREANFEPAARGLLLEVKQFKFIAFVHMLMDILPFLTTLSKKFQAESLDFSTVEPMVASTCESLTDLCEVEGVFVEKLKKYAVSENGKFVYRRPLSESNCENLKKEIQTNIAFEGFSSDDDSDQITEENVGYEPELKYFDQQQNIVKSIMPEYIDKLTENLKDRFKNTEILGYMSVLIPSNICSAESVAKFGLSEVNKLVEHFSEFIPEPENTRSEYQTYKRLVLASYSHMNVGDILKFLLKTNDLVNMIAILKCCVVIPVTSVQCERGFSTQNRIKTKSRTSLKSETLDDLMRISEDGPIPSEFDFSRALGKWKLRRNRKLYA